MNSSPPSPTQLIAVDRMSSSERHVALIRDSTLSQLNRRVRVPSYDRRACRPGIVHIGAGGFNRSHLAVYLDDLLELGTESAAERQQVNQWAELGIGLLAADRDIHSALAQQDFLYGVLERDLGVQNYRIVGSLVGHFYAPENQEAVLAALASTECRIISLTVTEGGYFLSDATREFQAEDASIQLDLRNPAAPTTWVGFVAEAAHRRMQSGGGPFTLLSCDNLHANGDAARAALLAFASLRDDRLSAWIEANVAFPNSMVDRITPKTTAADREQIADIFGVEDLSPVVTEPFRQWVLEDKFAAGRPAFESVGVQMTADAAPYEKTKMRLLNGGHLCIAYFAALLDFDFVADAVADPQLGGLLEAFLAEVRPTLKDLPGIQLEEYSASVVQRFANRAIRDQISRICSEGCAKVAKFLVPTLGDLLESGQSSRMLELVLAGWLYASLGRREDGTALPVEDSKLELLQPFLGDGERTGLALGVAPLFGTLAERFPALLTSVQFQFDALRHSGVRATLATELAQAAVWREKL